MLKYLITTTILFASPLAAGSLRVVADIAPVHSLTAQVMGDLGAPELLTAPGANPHSHALRPSEAARLQNADLLVWIGPLMSPWLGEAKAEMAPDAASLSLMEAEGTLLLDKRGAEDHDHTHEHEHEHERNHDDNKDHDSHDEETAAKDAHAWLSPDNALIWLTRIADRLASLDPDNAATYHSNAAAAGEALKLQIAETEARLAPLAAREFLTAHDAYQYFQRRFGLTSHAAVSNADDQDAGPAHLRALLEDGADLACFVVEPSTAKASIALVVDTLNIPAVEIDALGAALPLGKGHYAALMAHLTEGFQTCLTP
ncbi:zinc ABC transporter substrate-binding protein [uncultured Lentibacter sp.]|uniref:zinc ABC transporter substrate-binding protein n=1 Tax=uncultured Lentibacter sp. TaxID=1659309 RepID=UPI0026394B63|nr:zinc ABC transporter substrate-binding protein [uncultured Lentibacter sp.]